MERRGCRTSPRRAAGRGPARADSPPRPAPARRCRRLPLLDRLIVLQAVAQIGLAPRLALVDRLDAGLHDLDVGHDALGLDRGPGRRVVARRGQADRAMAGQRHDGLHRALAERAGAHHDRPAVILQRAGHDLGGRGRAAVDQHHDRQAVDQVAAPGVEPLHAVGAPAAGGHDLALVEEGVGDRDRLLEQPARVVAQVDARCPSCPGRALPRAPRPPGAGWPRSAR